MKIGALLLTVSLAANLILGALAWRSAAPAIARPPAALPATVTAAAPAPSTQPAAAAARRPALWAGLPPVVPVTSLDDAIARLRRAGCPPREIVAAIRAMIEEIGREKRAALGYANETLPYWKQYQRFNEPRPANEFAALFQEAQQLERTYLLGDPELFAADENRVAQLRERYGIPDVEKLRRLALIESAANDRRMENFQTGSSIKPGEARYGENQQTYREIEQQQTAAIAALLTPAEFTAYELRNGPIATSLRFRLEAFAPTEQEYLALFAVEKAFRNVPGRENLTPEQSQADYAQYLAAMKAALSPERAADYEALQKAGSDQLPRLMNRLGLPLVTVSFLNGVRDQTNARAKAIRADPQLNPAERAARLSALAAEAETSIATTLGSQRALDAYKDLKGEWLRALRPTKP